MDKKDKSESESESESGSDDEKDPYASLKRPADAVGDVRKLELLYFKPECVPDAFSAILYGQRRTGKTTWLTWFLYCMQGKIDHVVCFSSTNFTGHYSQYMNPDLCYDEYNEDVLQKVLDIQAATPAAAVGMTTPSAPAAASTATTPAARTRPAWRSTTPSAEASRDASTRQPVQTTHVMHTARPLAKRSGSSE